jgi:hypothetical protein
MTADALRALLEGLIDYAGLFPPAALTMQGAVRNYARYREERYAFALGRFVVPAERANEVPAEFPLSILWRPGVDVDDLAVAETATLEARAASAEEVAAIASAAQGRTVFVEIADLSLVSAIAEHGLRAKIRTGGITADAFPAIADVAAFIDACRKAGVAFKATAGLHHPLRCLKPLTYEPDAPTGTMHGFLNVFMAAAMPDYADAILREDAATAFAFDDDGASWRDHRVSTTDLRRIRRELAISFGSCSFEEPIADLQELGWLSDDD